MSAMRGNMIFINIFTLLLTNKAIYLQVSICKQVNDVLDFHTDVRNIDFLWNFTGILVRWNLCSRWGKEAVFLN